MNTFDFIKSVNQIFGRNFFSGTPEQQQINVKIAELLKEYRETIKEQQ